MREACELRSEWVCEESQGSGRPDPGGSPPTWGKPGKKGLRRGRGR